ncbi:hypothetical protein [Paraburkholderia sp. BCC1876]|uniref:hypothetical protein n=1 Tax=Paraburkholderia sp. BCC1876 TaxID=2676303 RepID=UPI0015929601|nr:hypothetical protein [Paraburkholderia sp. BCC1876]
MELMTTESTAFNRAAYLRSKVLDSLASQCHEQNLPFSSLAHEEMADAYSEAGTALHAKARKLFPLYPHRDFMAGKEWARATGFGE